MSRSQFPIAIANCIAALEIMERERRDELEVSQLYTTEIAAVDSALLVEEIERISTMRYQLAQYTSEADVADSRAMYSSFPF